MGEMMTALTVPTALVAITWADLSPNRNDSDEEDDEDAAPSDEDEEDEADDASAEDADAVELAAVESVEAVDVEELEAGAAMERRLHTMSSPVTCETSEA